jgi:RNA polymerase sigma factor (sigma-70 family)
VIRVLIVDDHAAFRQPLAFMLEREPDMTVVAEAGSLAEARRVLRGADVAIVDLRLPDGDGVDLIKDLRAANRQGAILVLTAERDRKRVARAVGAGAAGVLHKSAPIEAVIDAVRRLAAGEPLFSPSAAIELLRLADRLKEQDRTTREAIGRLTPRERQVLQALAEGLTNDQIAHRLGIGTETVRRHLAHTFDKLGVDSRVQALAFAVRHDLVDLQ